MTAEIRDNGASLGEDAINDLMRKLNVVFPEQYKRFLMQHNGGYPEPDGFMLADGSDGSSVDRFLGTEGTSTLEGYFRTYQERIPKGMLPIAHDPGGNLVLIQTVGKDTGKVYFWDHEMEVDNGEPDTSNVHYVSQSINEFLDGLHEYEI